MADNIKRTYTPAELQELVEAGIFRPMWYPLILECGNNEGDAIEGQSALTNRPFVIQRITHQQITDGINTIAVNDDLYTLDWSIYSQIRFYKGSPPMAAAAFGSARNGIWQDLEVPITVRGNETLHVTIQNMVQRTNDWKVQVIFKGVERVDKTER